MLPPIRHPEGIEHIHFLLILILQLLDKRPDVRVLGVYIAAGRSGGIQDADWELGRVDGVADGEGGGQVGL